MKWIATCLLFLMFKPYSFSQSVSIGSSNPHASALLDMHSTDKGLLLPRMSSTQRDNITAPATGLLVFDTDKGAIYMFDGMEWLPLAVSKNELHAQPRTAPEPAHKTGFGWQASISGNYAAISSCKATSMTPENVVDTVYIYEKVNGSWTYRTKLTQNDALPGDGFGRALALAGDQLLVGAPHRNNNFGAVYAFSRSGNTWTQTGILTPSTPQGGQFGSAISMGGTYALIGAPYYFNNGVGRGAVYSFIRSGAGWTQTQQLFGISGLEGFGESLDVSGTDAIIGAPRSAYNGINFSGIAYYFKRTGTVWAPEDTIYNVNAEVNDAFGKAVAINESTHWAFISRPGRHGAGANTGQVLTYNVSAVGLTHWGILTSATTYQESVQNFGAALSVYNNHLVIGVPGAFNGDAAKGKVYIYRYDQTFNHPSDNWQPWKVIKDESMVQTANYYDTYGLSVFINGSDLIIGNPGANNFKGKVLFLNIY